jgi:hypothetical protein
MTTALRPMNTGEILDRIFSLYRNNFILFAGIASLAAIVLVALTGALIALGLSVSNPNPQMDPRELFAKVGIFFGAIALFYLFIGSFATGATIYAVSKVHLGQSVTIREAYGRVFPRLGRIVLILILIFLIMIAILVLSYLVALALGLLLGLFMTGSAGSGGRMVAAIVTGVVAGLAIVGGYVLMIRAWLKYSLSIPACLLENTGPVQSLKRSSFLAKGSLWRIFLIYLLMAVVNAALSVALQLPGNIFIRTAPLVAVAWQLIATFFSFSVSYPISTIAISLIYYDQRIKKEAFDLQIMMDALGQTNQQQTISATPIG